MNEATKIFLLDNFLAIIGSFAALIAWLGTVLISFGKGIEKIKTIERTLKEIREVTLKEIKDDIKQNAIYIRQNAKDIKQNAIQISHILGLIQNLPNKLLRREPINENFFATNSPLSLTVEGLELLESTGLASLFEINKKWFINAMKKRKPRDEVDIHKYSLDILSNQITPEIQEQFEVAEYESGVPDLILKKAVALYYRDQAIKELLNN